MQCTTLKCDMKVTAELLFERASVMREASLNDLPALTIIERWWGGTAMLLSDINWTVTSIAIVLVGCWLLAEFIEFFEDRKRMRQRYT